jgi:hypothetical protein|tara:strand:- start:4819 stop:5682 length:864 start_codon:yes stop_codon:yes gene_type:complete
MTLQAEVDGTGDLVTFGAATAVAEPEEEAPTTPVEVAPAEQGEQAEGTEQEGKKEEPDYKSLYEAEQAKSAKLEQRESSIRGNTRKQAERDRDVAVLGDQVSGMKDAVAALAKGIASNDLSAVPDELAEVDLRTTEAVQSRQVSSMRDSLLEQIHASARGSDGESLFDVNEEPALEAARQLWVEGSQGAGDPMKMTLAAMQVGQFAREAERSKIKEASDRRYAEGRKKGLDEAGVDDMAAPEGSGSNGTAAGVAARDKYAAGDNLTPAEEKALQGYREAQGFTKLNS